MAATVEFTAADAIAALVASSPGLLDGVTIGLIDELAGAPLRYQWEDKGLVDGKNHGWYNPETGDYRIQGVMPGSGHPKGHGDEGGSSRVAADGGPEGQTMTPQELADHAYSAVKDELHALNIDDATQDTNTKMEAALTALLESEAGGLAGTGGASVSQRLADELGVNVDAFGSQDSIAAQLVAHYRKKNPAAREEQAPAEGAATPQAEGAAAPAGKPPAQMSLSELTAHAKSAGLDPAKVYKTAKDPLLGSRNAGQVDSARKRALLAAIDAAPKAAPQAKSQQTPAVTPRQAAPTPAPSPDTPTLGGEAEAKTPPAKPPEQQQPAPTPPPKTTPNPAAPPEQKPAPVTPKDASPPIVGDKQTSAVPEAPAPAEATVKPAAQVTTPQTPPEVKPKAETPPTQAELPLPKPPTDVPAPDEAADVPVAAGPSETPPPEAQPEVKPEAQPAPQSAPEPEQPDAADGEDGEAPPDLSHLRTPEREKRIGALAGRWRQAQAAGDMKKSDRAAIMHAVADVKDDWALAKLHDDLVGPSDAPLTRQQMVAGIHDGLIFGFRDTPQPTPTNDGGQPQAAPTGQPKPAAAPQPAPAEFKPSAEQLKAVGDLFKTDPAAAWARMEEMKKEHAAGQKTPQPTPAPTPPPQPAPTGGEKAEDTGPPSATKTAKILREKIGQYLGGEFSDDMDAPIDSSEPADEHNRPTIYNSVYNAVRQMSPKDIKALRDEYVGSGKMAKNEAMALQIVSHLRDRVRQGRAAKAAQAGGPGTPPPVPPVPPTGGPKVPPPVPPTAPGAPAPTAAQKPPQPSVTGLNEAFGGLGQATTANMYDSLYEAYRKGKLKNHGVADPMLHAADMLRKTGRMLSEDEFRQFANEVQRARDANRGGDLQSAMQGVVQKWAAGGAAQTPGVAGGTKTQPPVPGQTASGPIQTPGKNLPDGVGPSSSAQWKEAIDGAYSSREFIKDKIAGEPLEPGWQDDAKQYLLGENQWLLEGVHEALIGGTRENMSKDQLASAIVDFIGREIAKGSPSAARTAHAGQKPDDLDGGKQTTQQSAAPAEATGGMKTPPVPTSKPNIPPVPQTPPTSAGKGTPPPVPTPKDQQQTPGGKANVPPPELTKDQKAVLDADIAKYKDIAAREARGERLPADDIPNIITLLKNLPPWRLDGIHTALVGDTAGKSPLRKAASIADVIEGNTRRSQVSRYIDDIKAFARLAGSSGKGISPEVASRMRGDLSQRSESDLKDVHKRLIGPADGMSKPELVSAIFGWMTGGGQKTPPPVPQTPPQTPPEKPVPPPEQPEQPEPTAGATGPAEGQPTAEGDVAPFVPTYEPDMTPDARRHAETFAKSLTDNANLSPEKKRQYFGDVKSVLRRMTPEAMRRFGNSFKGVKFFDGPDDLHKYRLESTTDPDALAYLKSGRGRSACFRWATGEMLLHGGKSRQDDDFVDHLGDGRAAGVYAHEIGHAIDGEPGKGSLSESRAWLGAFKRELSKGQLTQYSKSSEREGFAEFNRLVGSGEYDLAKVRAMFPECYQFYVDNGLAPDVKPAGRWFGAKKVLADIFGAKIDLRGGDHIDVQAPVRDPNRPGANLSPDELAWVKSRQGALKEAAGRSIDSGESEAQFLKRVRDVPPQMRLAALEAFRELRRRDTGGGGGSVGASLEKEPPIITAPRRTPEQERALQDRVERIKSMAGMFGRLPEVPPEKKTDLEAKFRGMPGLADVYDKLIGPSAGTSPAIMAETLANWVVSSRKAPAGGAKPADARRRDGGLKNLPFGGEPLAPDADEPSEAPGAPAPTAAQKPPQPSVGPGMKEAFGGMGQATTANMYKGLHKAYQKGWTSHNGVANHILHAADVLKDAGRTLSEDEFRQFADEVQRARDANRGGDQQPATDDVVRKWMDGGAAAAEWMQPREAELKRAALESLDRKGGPHTPEQFAARFRGVPPEMRPAVVALYRSMLADRQKKAEQPTPAPTGQTPAAPAAESRPVPKPAGSATGSDTPGDRQVDDAVDAPLPSWMVEDREANYDFAKKIGILDKIEDLAVSEKTAKEIVRSLQPEFDKAGVPADDRLNIVLAARLKMGIPSMTAPSMAGGQEVTPEFLRWQDKKRRERQSKAQLGVPKEQTSPAPSVDELRRIGEGETEKPWTPAVEASVPTAGQKGSARKGAKLAKEPPQTPPATAARKPDVPETPAQPNVVAAPADMPKQKKAVNAVKGRAADKGGDKGGVPEAEKETPTELTKGKLTNDLVDQWKGSDNQEFRDGIERAPTNAGAAVGGPGYSGTDVFGRQWKDGAIVPAAAAPADLTEQQRQVAGKIIDNAGRSQKKKPAASVQQPAVPKKKPATEEEAIAEAVAAQERQDEAYDEARKALSNWRHGTRLKPRDLAAKLRVSTDDAAAMISGWADAGVIDADEYGNFVWTGRPVRAASTLEPPREGYHQTPKPKPDRSARAGMALQYARCAADAERRGDANSARMYRQQLETIRG